MPTVTSTTTLPTTATAAASSMITTTTTPCKRRRSKQANSFFLYSFGRRRRRRRRRCQRYPVCLFNRQNEARGRQREGSPHRKLYFRCESCKTLSVLFIFPRCVGLGFSCRLSDNNNRGQTFAADVLFRQPDRMLSCHSTNVTISTNGR